MNWQYKLLIIATLIVAFSCNKKANEVIELQPTNEVGAIFIDDFPITASTVRYDSVRSDRSVINSYLVGTLDDAETGKTIASTFFQVDLPNLVKLSNLDYSSAELHIAVASYYGNETTCNILINELEDTIQGAESYVFDNLSIGPNIGSFSINTASDIEEVLVIPLSESFGKSVFNYTYNSLDSLVVTEADFRNNLKGITFQPQNGNAIINLGETFIRIISGADTLDYSLGGVRAFNRVVTDGVMGDLSTLITHGDESISNEKVVVQGSTKLNVRLSSDSLRDFLSDKNIAIYKAELIVTPSLNESFDPSQLMHLFLGNDNTLEYREALLNQFGDPTISLQDYAELVDSKYTYDITDYLQNVVTTDLELDDFMLSISAVGHTVERTIIENPSENISIEIYYTQL